MKNEEGFPGLFLVEGIKDETVLTCDLITGKKFTFKLPKEIMVKKAVHLGMLFHAIVKVSKAFVCKYLESMYPPSAFRYVKENYLE
jgi:hypothetical protein